MGAQAVRLSNVDIDNALKNKEFEVLFQPIFDLGNGALARVETFVRWRHPSLGVLPPGAFISFFETQGRMSELTRYVLAGALNAYIDWRGPFAPGFSINLALSDLGDDAFATHFAKVLRDNDFPTDLVTLECPMPPVDVDLDTASAHFARLRETGARLAIEVRGRANDLLRNIDPFPFDEIKTGGSAILRFARTVRGPGLSAIADLLDIANRSNAAITAVGVEDQASLAALRGLGFTAAQGNHLAKVGDLKEFRPARVNEVRKLLDLEPLSADSLAALFRTEAPAPSAADTPHTDGDSAEATEQNDDAAVVAPNQDIDAETGAVTTVSETSATGAARSDDSKKTRVREKAKALALAKRAKARDARKAAAIERAKAKLARAKQKAEQAAQNNRPTEDAFPPGRAPRDLQEQLNKEFAGGDAPKISPSPELESGEEPAPIPKFVEEAPTAQPEAPQPVIAEPVASEPAALDDASDKTPAKDEKPETSADEKAEKREPAETPDAVRSAEVTGGAGKSDNASAPTDAPKATDAPVADTPGAAAVLDKISMAVGAARAHFRPGIRVGNPALRSDGAAAPMPQQPEPAQSGPRIEMPLTEDAAANQTDEALGDVVPPTDEQVSPIIAFDEPKFDTNAEPLVQGDLHNVPEIEIVEPGPRKKRRKNFLTRKYRLMPTHFWPKSWTGRQQRLAARKIEKQSTQETAPVQQAADS